MKKKKTMTDESVNVGTCECASQTDELTHLQISTPDIDPDPADEDDPDIGDAAEKLKEAVEKAKETYEFVTGDEWTDSAAAERWIAEEYEPPEEP